MSTSVAMKMQQSKSLNLGQWDVTDEPETVLVCLGLGSCVALCLHDPVAKVGGMAHMVLPDSRDSTANTGAKFVDVAVPMVVEEMENRGAVRRRLICYLVGGAHIVINNSTPLALVGERNVEAARTVLKEQRIHVRDVDVGGGRGRTVRMHVGSGQLVVAHAGEAGRELSNGRS